MAWFSLTVDTKLEKLEQVEAVLHDAGTSGLEVRDGVGPMIPNVRAPSSGEAIVVAYFDGKVPATRAEKKILQVSPKASVLIEKVDDRDWSSEWKSRVKSVQVGRLWVGPPWLLEQAAPHLQTIVIEPKMAFGTGDHPTTSLCLSAIDLFMASHGGASVLDVGTGTGVLAFAAKKLGAERVVAIDNDPIAVQLAQEAAAENGLKGIEISAKSLAQIRGTFDLVVANILANTLIELAPKLAAFTQKRLVLAGVLVPQAQDVTAAFVKQGLTALEPVVSGEWVRLDFEQR